MRFLFLFLFSLPLFGVTKVAVAGGMWPIPSLLKVWTDAELIYMPKASLNMIKNSVLIDFFPELEKIKVGPNSDDSVEELLKLKADLYICHNAQKNLCSTLEKSGAKALDLGVNMQDYNSKKTLEYWLSSLEKYFPDIKEKNQRLVDNITQTEQFIADSIKDRQKPKVLIIHRLDKGVVTTGFFANYLSEYSGGDIFSNQKAFGNNRININLEEIYKKNPDIIYISNFTSLMPQDLLENQEWQGIKAIKDKKIYKLPLATYRPYAPSLDLAPLLLYLAKQNHPEVFKDLDIAKAYKEHFKTFYRLDLNEEQVEKILNPSSSAGKLQ